MRGVRRNWNETTDWKTLGLSGQCIGILLMALALAGCGGSDTGTGDGEFSSVSAGFRYTCGVQTGGSVACGGYNKHGKATPPEGEFSSVSAGEEHACGVRAGGSVACWGIQARGLTAPTGS